jgi:histone H3/H4
MRPLPLHRRPPPPLPSRFFLSPAKWMGTLRRIPPRSRFLCSHARALEILLGGGCSRRTRATVPPPEKVPIDPPSPAIRFSCSRRRRHTPETPKPHTNHGRRRRASIGTVGRCCRSRREPRDARVVRELLRSMGLGEGEYEPRVVHQFLDLAYRYVGDVLGDAQVYADHAGKAQIDADDVRLAIQAKVNFSFSQPPPREVPILPYSQFGQISWLMFIFFYPRQSNFLPALVLYGRVHET